MPQRIEKPKTASQAQNVQKEALRARTEYLQTGLTQAQVKDRASRGLSNVAARVKEKTAASIVAENTFTLFNGINLFLAVLVCLTGSWRNMLFMLVVGANVCIGIAQELRARASLKSLSLLVAETVEVIRDGKELRIEPQNIVQGDLLNLRAGQQIPCDCSVVSGEAEANEALLTGEADLVHKKTGDMLYSGSFLAAGSLKATAQKVGAHSFIADISRQVKTYKKPQSQILSTLRFIIKGATIYLIPVGILLFLRTFFAETGTVEPMGPSVLDAFSSPVLKSAILTTTAALVGMIPQGLVLLTSAVLTLSVVRLAQKKVLVKQFYSIETLARVDTLCLDKTGTITSGKMKVSDTWAAKGVAQKEVLRLAAAVMCANEDSANQTARAIIAAAQGAGVAGFAGVSPCAGSVKNAGGTSAVKTAILFASERKYSGCTLASGKSYVVGAPEYISPAFAQKSQNALRVLALAEVDGFSQDGELKGDTKLMGYIYLADELRPGIKETLRYFAEQGVRLLVLSGDSAQTAAAIAEAAGLKGPGDTLAYLDADELLGSSKQARKSPEEIAKRLESVSVVGRCTPYAKEKIIEALRSAGHTTAMTGDGVNDILAMRAADTSLAMAQGAEAARAVGQFVLVNNDFSYVPEAVGEGRRSINNLIRSAALFLEKTVFSMALAACACILPPYPLLPIQLTLLSAALIGIPSFVLALEPNHKRVTGNFFKQVFSRALPAGLAISLSIAGVLAASEALGLVQAEVATFACLIISVTGVALLLFISWPLNLFRTVLIGFVIALLLLGFFLFPSFFEIAPLSGTLELLACGFALISLALYTLFTFLARRIMR